MFFFVRIFISERLNEKNTVMHNQPEDRTMEKNKTEVSRTVKRGGEEELFSSVVGEHGLGGNPAKRSSFPRLVPPNGTTTSHCISASVEIPRTHPTCRDATVAMLNAFGRGAQYCKTFPPRVRLHRIICTRYSASREKIFFLFFFSLKMFVHAC